MGRLNGLSAIPSANLRQLPVVVEVEHHAAEALQAPAEIREGFTAPGLVALEKRGGLL